ncbi:hypothetical protein [Desulfotruncus arcticus]|uniref:hypothetical protein n=1 Tax=Desulfotruncus arcticus TaxID=341036 RepID=UPI00157C861A|nr:hypothetical protein [Desulfotruncus arcticus]
MPQETAPLLKELDDAASEPIRFRPPGKVELLGAFLAGRWCCDSQARSGFCKSCHWIS